MVIFKIKCDKIKFLLSRNYKIFMKCENNKCEIYYFYGVIFNLKGKKKKKGADKKEYQLINLNIRGN